MGAIEPTIQALADKVGSACQVVAICGRNKRLIKRLEAKSYPAGMQVTIQGFVDNMPQWMTACDMIVSKAGPGTIAESFICGLPVLLNGFVPCQEEGNVPFVVKNKVMLCVVHEIALCLCLLTPSRACGIDSCCFEIRHKLHEAGDKASL